MVASSGGGGSASLAQHHRKGAVLSLEHVGMVREQCVGKVYEKGGGDGDGGGVVTAAAASVRRAGDNAFPERHGGNDDPQARICLVLPMRSRAHAAERVRALMKAFAHACVHSLMRV